MNFHCKRENQVQTQKGFIQAENSGQNKPSGFNAFPFSVRVIKEVIKFSVSSLFCAAIDIGLFTLIFNLLSASTTSWSLFTATSIARLFSSVTNFLINKKVVFKNRDSLYTQAAKYFALCAVQMILSWLILQGLASLSSRHVVLLKIIADVFLFLINFLVQRIFIFRRRNIHEKNT